MDRFVTLERLPTGFVIPQDLADRMSYDAATRRLAFRGYMSKSEFDRLSLLTNDWSFRRKLEELFQSCVYNEPPGHSPRGGGRLSGFLKRFVPG
jgi:hypothetical protein